MISVEVFLDKKGSLKKLLSRGHSESGLVEQSNDLKSVCAAFSTLEYSLYQAVSLLGNVVVKKDSSDGLFEMSVDFEHDFLQAHVKMFLLGVDALIREHASLIELNVVEVG